MPSKNKTTFLQLNQWEPNDQPQRVDFNADNQKIDEAMAEQNQKIESTTEALDQRIDTVVSEGDAALSAATATLNIKIDEKVRAVDVNYLAKTNTLSNDIARTADMAWRAQEMLWLHTNELPIVNRDPTARGYYSDNLSTLDYIDLPKTGASINYESSSNRFSMSAKSEKQFLSSYSIINYIEEPCHVMIFDLAGQATIKTVSHPLHTMRGGVITFKYFIYRYDAAEIPTELVYSETKATQSYGTNIHTNISFSPNINLAAGKYGVFYTATYSDGKAYGTTFMGNYNASQQIFDDINVRTFEGLNVLGTEKRAYRPPFTISYTYNNPNLALWIRTKMLVFGAAKFAGVLVYLRHTGMASHITAVRAYMANGTSHTLVRDDAFSDDTGIERYRGTFSASSLAIGVSLSSAAPPEARITEMFASVK